MSRTRNTAPMRVQAHTMPPWATAVWHSVSCDRGGPCTYTPGFIPPRSYDPDVCHLETSWWHGPTGGSRHGQHLHAHEAETRTRASIRNQTRAAVRAANTARRDTVERFADGTAVADWDLDVHTNPADIANALY